MQFLKNKQQELNVVDLDIELLTQCLEIGLSNSSISSASNSFSLEVGKDYLDFIPRIPCSYILDNNLYQSIYKILSSCGYPTVTFLKQPTTYFVKKENRSFNTLRAFRFPFFLGIPERLFHDNLSDVVVENSRFELMKNFHVDFNKVVHLLIAGSSGSGKSYALTYLLSVMKKFAHIEVVDPKTDSITRFCLENDISVLYQNKDYSSDEFVAKVNSILKLELDTIYSRQLQLLENPNQIFQHRCIVIDELLALTTLASKGVKETFFALLSNIALLGRTTSCHLVLVSQRMDTNALPIAVREQANFLWQLGPINKKTSVFLFPDLEDSEGLLIPNEKGSGIVQLIDGVSPPNIMPLLIPTIRGGL